jgi:hypothetical protein
LLLEKGVTSQCLSLQDGDCSLALAFDGTLYSVKGSDVKIDKALPREEEPDANLWMFSLRRIAGCLYAAGMLRRVYRQRAGGDWEHVGDGAKLVDASALETGFRDVAGWSDIDLTCVGLGGEIWSFDGSSWQQVGSPTGVRLDAALQVDERTVIACGERGTVLRGHRHAWRVLASSNAMGDLKSIEAFNGRTFLASRSGIYELCRDELRVVDTGLGRPITTGYLSACGESMWSVGNLDIVVFDGRDWSDVPSPFRPGS